MNLDALVVMFDYNAWANERVCSAAAAAPSADFLRPTGSTGTSLRDTLVHIVWSEWIWLQRWTGVTDLVFQPADFPQAPPGLVFRAEDFPDVAAIHARARAVAGDLAAFVRGLSCEQLARVDRYRTLDGRPWQRALWRQLVHAVNHSSYHRGQVAMLTRQLGHVPSPTDFVGYEG